MISIILAVDRNGLIGRDGSLPWHLPEDLQYFRKQTLGYPVIMGRKTYEAIGHPLPGRRNIVLSRTQSLAGVETAASADALLTGGITFGQNCFVIGGASVFDAFWPFADRFYVTKIDAEFEGDTFFHFVPDKSWHLVSENTGKMDAENIYPHTFFIYERS
ncbi:MAG: dihydrofolate reductase [Sporolactobacillus sp.]